MKRRCTALIAFVLGFPSCARTRSVDEGETTRATSEDATSDPNLRPLDARPGFVPVGEPGDYDNAVPVFLLNDGGDSSLQDALHVGPIAEGIRLEAARLARRCWRKRSANTSRAFVWVTADGNVSNVAAEGSDRSLNRCLESALKGALFPATSSPHTVSLSFGNKEAR